MFIQYVNVPRHQKHLFSYFNLISVRTFVQWRHTHIHIITNALVPPGRDEGGGWEEIHTAHITKITHSSNMKLNMLKLREKAKWQCVHRAPVIDAQACRCGISFPLLSPPFFSFSCFLLLSSFQPLSFCVSLSVFLFHFFLIFSLSLPCRLFSFIFCCCFSRFHLLLLNSISVFQFSNLFILLFFSFSYSRMDQRIRYYCNSQAQRHVLASLKAEANQRQRRQFWVSLILHLLLIFLPFFSPNAYLLIKPQNPAEAEKQLVRIIGK